jgi:exodeoxyribonuclease VII, large subunit
VKQEAITVTALNRYIKQLLEQDDFLSAVVVRGELSNFKAYPSGHLYFSLKDKESSIRCVMFRSAATRLRFEPKHGMAVLIYGNVSAFPRDGQYQLYATHMVTDGAGDLHVAFEQLKEKLEREGLFDPVHKKPIPKFPKTVALITSEAGAAVRDMIRILGERFPSAQVKVLPVLVQGERAPAEIVGAIRYVNRWQVADVIITGRGGGSLEDLWAFNDEQVARAIFESDIPLISAVGHEPDVTIADYVADLRASTPSNAAELAVPDRQELLSNLSRQRAYMARCVGEQLQQEQVRLERLSQNRHLQNPVAYLNDKELLLDRSAAALEAGLQQSLDRGNARLSNLAALLDSLSPLKVLGRGYALAQNKDGLPISSAKAVKKGDRLTLTVQDGQIQTIVEGTRKHGKASKAELRRRTRAY